MGTKNIRLPLAYSSHRQIVDAERNLVIEVFSGGAGIEGADELQALVVTACNTHDQLVAALKDAVDSLEYVQKYLPGAIGCAVRHERIVAANAALTGDTLPEKRFNICNRVSGKDLGTFEATTRKGALEVMAKKHGFPNYDIARGYFNDGDLNIREVK